MTDQNPIDPNLTLAEFDYFLPPDLIAQTPPLERDGGRLLLVDRAGKSLSDRTIRDLPDVLQPNDLVVINTTKVIPARLRGIRSTGGKTELLLLNHTEDGSWEALARPARAFRPEATMQVVAHDGDTATTVTVIENRREGRVLVRFDPPIDERLDDFGEVPLPPYIHAALGDQSRYQTVYGEVPGSAAAPTAGLHLTDRIFADLQMRGDSYRKCGAADRSRYISACNDRASSRSSNALRMVFSSSDNSSGNCRDKGDWWSNCRDWHDHRPHTRKLGGRRKADG